MFALAHLFLHKSCLINKHGFSNRCRTLISTPRRN